MNFHRPDLTIMCNIAGKFGGKWDMIFRWGSTCTTSSFPWPSSDALACCEEPPFSLFPGTPSPSPKEKKRSWSHTLKSLLLGPCLAASVQDKHQMKQKHNFDAGTGIHYSRGQQPLQISTAQTHAQVQRMRLVWVEQENKSHVQRGSRRMEGCNSVPSPVCTEQQDLFISFSFG